jgi:hypothetical protein
VVACIFGPGIVLATAMGVGMARDAAREGNDE